MPGTRLVAAAALVAVLLALAGCSRPPPPSLCAVCDSEFQDTARANGANVTVEGSEVHVYVGEDGSARWEARVDLSGDGVEALRSNVSLRSHVVQKRFDDNDGPHHGRREDVTTAMAGSTLVVRYETDGVAHPGVRDVLLVDEFFEADGEPRSYALRASRLVLHPPDGWTVLNDPSSGSVASDVVVWQHTPGDDTYVALGPRESREMAIAARVTIAADVADWGGPVILTSSLLPILLVVGGAIYLMGKPTVEGLDRPDHVRHADVLASLALSAAGVTTLLVVAIVYGPTIAATASIAFVTLLGVPTVLFAVAGWLSARGTALRWAPVVVTAVIPVPVTAQYVREWSLLATLVGVGWAVVALAIGVPVFLAVEQGVSSQSDGSAVR